MTPRRPSKSILSVLGAGLLAASVTGSDGQTRPATARVERRPPTTAPLSISRARQEFASARNRLVAARQSIERADRQRAAAIREQGLADWRRTLDGLKPTVARLDATVPAEAALLADYQTWRAEYAELAGLESRGTLFLNMQRRWAELTQPADGWRNEKEPVTFARLKEKPDDPANASMGLPKTAAFARGADEYLREVRQMAAYPYFDDSPEIANDLTQARAARDEAYAKLAAAADGVYDEAAASSLDQAGRDRIETFTDRDVRENLAGYDKQAEVVARGEKLVDDYDVAKHGEARAAELRHERLARTAPARWKAIRDRYDARPLAEPSLAQRGTLVSVDGFANQLGDVFRSDDHDLAVEVNGYPVVMRFDPELKRQYNAAMERDGAKAPPADARYDVVGVVSGLTQVEHRVAANATEVSATTRPTADNPEARIELPATTRAGTRPTSRSTRSDAVVVDVVALHVGSVAIGVAPPK